MDKKLVSVVGTLLATLAIFALVVWRVESTIGEDFKLGESIGPRFNFVIIGMLIVLIVYLFLQESHVWELNARDVTYMFIGAVTYAAFTALFNSSAFSFPSISQVALRPTIVIPMFFGYAFGPLVGFASGALGNLFGDALTGFGLSPQWSIGNGLIGFVTGLIFLLHDKKKGINLAIYISGALALAAAVVFFFNQNSPNKIFFDVSNNIFGDSQISFLAGISILIGFVLVIGIRIGIRRNEAILLAVTWGMLGNIIGIGFAAISDIWINAYDPVTAIVGEFLPAAGPNLIFAAVLLPLLVIVHQLSQQQQPE
jgi:hypothetical protein